MEDPLTFGKRVFHVLILSLVFSGNGDAYNRLSYVQDSTYRPNHTYYITVVLFVCQYVRLILAHPCRTVPFVVIATVWIGVIANIWIGVSISLAHLCTIL